MNKEQDKKRKFERTGIGTDREAKVVINMAFNYLKANGQFYLRCHQHNDERLHH